MDIWKRTKIKAKARHRKGMRLEWEGGFCARRKADIGFWARSGCEGGGDCYRIELWLEGRTECAWPGADIGTKQQHVKWEECVQSCWRLWLFNHNFVPSAARDWWNSLPTEVKQMVFSTHLVNYPPCE